MITSNRIPLLATIVEPLVGLAMIFNGYLILKKYLERKSIATLFLSLGIFSFGIGALISGIGKILGFYLPIPESEKNIAGFAIVVAYIFTVIANIFVMEFVSQIFKDGSSKSTLVFATLNGITIGFLIPNISFATDVYESILFFLIWHILISFYGYTNLSYHGIKEAILTDQRIPKFGFILIAGFGIMVNLLYILFVVDLVVGIITGSGYTVFYYLAWISGSIASVLAYLGLVMPDWLKRKLS